MAVIKKAVALSGEEYKRLKAKADAYDALMAQMEPEEPEEPPEGEGEES